MTFQPSGRCVLLRRVWQCEKHSSVLGPASLDQASRRQRFIGIGRISSTYPRRRCQRGARSDGRVLTVNNVQNNGPIYWTRSMTPRWLAMRCIGRIRFSERSPSARALTGGTGSPPSRRVLAQTRLNPRPCVTAHQSMERKRTGHGQHRVPSIDYCGNDQVDRQPRTKVARDVYPTGHRSRRSGARPTFLLREPRSC